MSDLQISWHQGELPPCSQGPDWSGIAGIHNPQLFVGAWACQGCSCWGRGFGLVCGWTRSLAEWVQL